VKAIRVREFGGPEAMKLEELPDPKPGAGQVVVRVHAVGVNPVDTYMRSGMYASKPALPYTPERNLLKCTLLGNYRLRQRSQGRRDPSKATCLGVADDAIS